MRTTVDLPPAVHYRMGQVAATHGVCLSTLISELATSAFNREYPQAETETSTVTGLPQLPLGHPVSSQDVAAFLAEEDQTSHSHSVTQGSTLVPASAAGGQAGPVRGTDTTGRPGRSRAHPRRKAP